MLYLRVGSLPEVKQLPAESRAQLLDRHIGPRFYFTLVGKSGILGALVYALFFFGLPRLVAPLPESLHWMALASGGVAGLIRYVWLMRAFRGQLRQAMEQG